MLMLYAVLNKQRTTTEILDRLLASLLHVTQNTANLVGGLCIVILILILIISLLNACQTHMLT